MLVLTRRPEQGIVIGEGIYIKILGIDRGRVKVGIMAPPGVPLLRAEIIEDVAGMTVEQLAAAGAQRRPVR